MEDENEIEVRKLNRKKKNQQKPKNTEGKCNHITGIAQGVSFNPY